MGVKHFFLHRAQKANKRIPGFTPFDKSNSYALLICGSEESNVAEQIEHLLRKEGKAVEKIILHPVKKKKESTENGNHAKVVNIYKDDLNLLKLPKNETPKEWIKEPFDYLILCGDEEYKSKESLLALSVSKCKIGKVKSVLSNHFDVLIDGSNNFPQTILNILKQIR